MKRARIFTIVDVSSGKDWASSLYGVAMVIVICFSILPLCFKRQNHLLVVMDNITVGIFIIDYVIRWSTCDFLHPSWSRWKSALLYPFSFFALVDLLSILPSLGVINRGFKLLKILRLLRTTKVFRLLRYSKSFEIITNVLKKERQALISVCCMAVGYIFVSGLIMFSTEPDTFSTFFDSLYWATTALTTVGYGDIYPVTISGKIVSMVSSVLGVAFVALPAGIITAGYLSALRDEQDET